MKKIAFSLLAASAVFPFCAGADGNTAEELEQKLSKYFADVYSEVKVKENAGVLEVALPEIETLDFAFNDEGSIEEVKSVIPPATMKVSEDGEFKGMPRYKLSTDSTARFKAVAYSAFDVQGIDVGSYKENLYFVPALNTVSAHSFEVGQISMAETDASTGTKEETAGISSLKMDMSWVPSGEDVAYKILWQVSGADFKSPFVSVKVPSASSTMTAVYKDENVSDYQKLLTNMSAVKTSESSFGADNVSVDIMGTSATFNIKSGGNVVRDDAAGSISIKADSLVDHIRAEALQGIGLNSVKVKYLLKNIPIAEVEKLAALQVKVEAIESKNANEENGAADNGELSPDEEALAKEVVGIVDDILKTAEYKMRIKLAFNDADAALLLALKKSGDYVVGNGKVTFINLDKIVPDYAKQCEAEQQNSPDSFPESCMKAGMSGMLRGYVDLSKRKKNDKGQTVDEIDIVLNETGAYVNGDKIGDAVEFNLSQMLAEYLVKQPLSSDEPATESATSTEQAPAAAE